MNASIRFIVWGTMPIGSFVGGLLGEALGARNVFWIGMVGSAVAALPVVLSPLVNMRDLPKEMDRLS
jgi:predicted MFS family arabinose efflux permease